jgi:hypothetical protein
MINRLARFTLVLALLASGAAYAEDTTDNMDNLESGFITPSANIACLLSRDQGKTTLRCDIAEMAAPPPRPADCKQNWGHSFEMAADGTAALICTDDHTSEPGLSDLDYGKVWQRGGFICRSEQTGLTCVNATQHGFTLSRAEQRIF